MNKKLFIAIGAAVLLIGVGVQVWRQRDYLRDLWTDLVDDQSIRWTDETTTWTPEAGNK